MTDALNSRNRLWGMFPRFFLCMAIVSLLTGWCASAQADDVSAGAKLASQARAARGSFQQPSAELFARQVAELRTAADALDRYLAEQGANGQAWRRYLRWDVLSTMLRSE